MSSDIRPAADRSEPDAPAWQRRLALGIFVFATLGGVAALVQRSLPADLPSVAATQVPCVSYAPFRRDGHSPFVAGLQVAPHLIEADLRQLAAITRCVRTYGVDNGLDAVPAIARRLGLRVVLGAWIGRDAATNEDQLKRALQLAREHADVVELLVVGNEVLLRRELAPQALAEVLARAKRESPVPVAYADVWEFWLRHGAVLRPHVDRVAVHVLPYWEDHAVANAAAAAHVHDIAARMRQAFAPLPVWVAETGWPAEGRQRGPAVPGRVEQARFIRELLAREAGAGALRFNLIEGFDQPWKRRLEGAMGGYWGWFDADGRVRVRLEGPMPADAHARRALWAAGLGALLGTLLGLRVAATRGRVGTGNPAVRRSALTAALAVGRVRWLATWLMTWGVVGAALGACAVMQWQFLRVWNRSPTEWALSLSMAAAAAAWVLMALPQLAHALAGTSPGPARADAHKGVVAAWRLGASRADRWQSGLLLALLFGTALTALQLVFDGRYRPLLGPLSGVAALVALLLSLLNLRLDALAREERLLAALCALLAVGLVGVEGVTNGQALVTATAWLALAAIAWPHRARPKVDSAAGVLERAPSAAHSSDPPVATRPAE
jgi:exo-beta-1,3-glucanase (GH17 family)